MKSTHEFNIHNRFDIEVQDSRTGKVRQKAQAENIVLNALWSWLCSSNFNSAWFSNIAYGTGSGTLAATRTTLFTFLAAKATGTPTVTFDFANGWCSARRAIVLSETEHVGAVLSELGISTSTSTGFMRTHAMLKDMNGNPVTITKTAYDIITIYATVYVRFPANAQFDSGKISAFTPVPSLYGKEVLYRLMGLGPFVGASSFSLRFFERAMPGCIDAGEYENCWQTGASAIIAATPTYDAANKRVSFYARLPVGSANGNYGIQSVALSSPSSNNTSAPSLNADLLDSTAFAGTTLNGEAIGTGNGATVDFKTKFPLVRTGAKIYVDGIEQTSGVTVDYNAPSDNELTPYLRIIRIDNPVETDVYDTLSPGQSRDWSMTGGQDFVVFENPHYATYGIYSAYLSLRLGLQASDDGITWETALDNSNTAHGVRVIPAGYRNKRYWRWYTTSAYGYRQMAYAFITTGHPGNIHFAVAPANGAVITADYQTPVAGKDVNHVFDYTFILQLGEYTP